MTASLKEALFCPSRAECRYRDLSEKEKGEVRSLKLAQIGRVALAVIAGAGSTIIFTGQAIALSLSCPLLAPLFAGVSAFEGVASIGIIGKIAQMDVEDLQRDIDGVYCNHQYDRRQANSENIGEEFGFRRNRYSRYEA
ncbi:MAG: hypothetical protein HYZ48_04830 [Chlamydiales bacterium]|nr:hypothetical protein [Chlamydiales bacterium]